MQVTFKPTNYKFNFDDRYFVQAVMDDNGQPFLGAFGEWSDAHAFAQVLQQRARVKMVFIFSRDKQHYDWHRPTHSPSNPPRLRKPTETHDEYRAAMGWQSREPEDNHLEQSPETGCFAHDA